MRKRILFVLMLCFVVALIFISSALADDPMRVSMELSTTRFKEPKLILVSITVTNVGDLLTREDSDAYNKEQASPAPVMNQ